MKWSDKKKIIVKLLVLVIAVALVILAGYALSAALGLNDITREELQELITATGVVAPLIFILISFAQVTLVPIPGAVTILAGNYIFGAPRAFLYSYLGMLLGAMVAFLLGRLIGRPFVNWMAGGEKKADEWISKLKGREKIVMFFMFLLPLFPDDLLCSIAGMLKYSTLDFFILQLITRATSILGTLLFMSGEIIPYNAWGISLIAVLALIGIVGFILAMKHYEKIEKWINRVFGKRNDK